MFENPRSTALSILFTQLILGSLSALLFLYFSGPLSAKSAITGTLIALFSSAHLFKLVFSPLESEPKKIVNSLYLMEALKFIITGALFGASIIFLKAMFFPLIIGYIVAVFVYWLSLLVV